MPWVYSVSSSTPPTYTWTGTNTLNQHCSAVNIPSAGAITQLKVYAAARSSTVSTRLVLWNVGGSALKQTSTFSMAVGSESPGGQYWYTKSISSYITSGGNFWVGLYRNPSGGHIAGTSSSGSNAYRKTNTSSFPSVSSMSGYSTHSGREFYVGAFYITAPYTPTGLSVSRNSDTSQTISWTRTANSDRPISGFKLYRYDNITGSYYYKATISGTYTTNGSNSYTDTSTSSNKYYKYKVYAYNDAGNSSYSSEDDINTTPLFPYSVFAIRTSGNVSLTWIDNARNEEYYKVQRRTSTDGITWTSYSTLTSTLAAGTTSYLDTSPANYNQYKVSATVSNPSLESTVVESNQVIILTTPDAPTLLIPDGLAFDAVDSLVFSWQHNPNDGSEQTKYSLQYKISGGSYPGTPQYDEIASTDEFVNISGSTFTNGENYIWQIKTWGDYTTGSAWSNEASFNTVTKPIAVITNPLAISNYIYSSLTLEWTYTQAESNNQSKYTAKLYDSSNNLLEEKTIQSTVATGDTDTAVFDQILTNNTDYKVTLSVWDSYDLLSDEVEVEFTTEFLQPMKPSISLQFNEDAGTMSIDIINPDVVVNYTENSTEDSYVDNDNSSTNYNNDSNLYLENDTAIGTTIKSILLNFDLSFFAGKGIENADLNLYRKTTLIAGIDSKVNYVTTAFDETTVTYGTIPTLDSTAYDTHTHLDGAYETWNITSLIEDISDGTITDYEGLAIVATTTDGSVDHFYDSTNSGFEPELLIEITAENEETSYNKVYRSIDGSTWELVNDNIPKNTQITDYIPGLGNTNNYYAEAISTLPSSNLSDEVEETVLLTGYYYINTGDDFSDYVGFIGDNDISENYDKDLILNTYQGRSYPVKYQGTQKNQSISFSSMVLNEDVAAVKILIDTNGEMIYRDYQGRWFKCAITAPTFKMNSNTSYSFHCIVNRIEPE